MEASPWILQHIATMVWHDARPHVSWDFAEDGAGALFCWPTGAFKLVLLRQRCARQRRVYILHVIVKVMTAETRFLLDLACHRVGACHFCFEHRVAWLLPNCSHLTWSIMRGWKRFVAALALAPIRQPIVSGSWRQAAVGDLLLRRCRGGRRMQKDSSDAMLLCRWVNHGLHPRSLQ